MLSVFNGHTSCVWRVEFSPVQSEGNTNDDQCTGNGVIGGAGYTLCSASHDNTICQWDIEESKELAVFKGHEHYVYSVKYSPTGTTLCSGSEDKTVRLWDIRSKKNIHTLRGHTKAVWTVEYERANIICSGSIDNTIRFWDTRVNKQLHVINGRDDDKGILSIYFQTSKNKMKKDGDQQLIYGTCNGPIRIYK
ncbi:WD-40 repeat protein [Reticulomyxa filosa]|uniref:WD-40 repeat protein n=1 Tax=Reticulomyxa filosa TaxID=46433 RepID=X6L7G7_RETFI|nr:WD-40 repeat protein [Reticulomyxa filosa]|eukprot:ETN97747.1 WD-40 repeat protein [Reticulomyxa filosa]